MDDDVVFCLNCFIDEQIGETNKEIEQNVSEFEYQRDNLQQTIDQSETIECEKENRIVENFTNVLQENNRYLSPTWQFIEDEFRKILHEISVNLDRLAVNAESQQITETIRSVSNRFRRQNEQIDSEISQLIETLDRYRNDNCLSRINSWFRQHFQYVEELYSNQEKLSNDRLNEQLFARKKIWDEREEIISDFIREIKFEEELIDELNQRIDNVKELIQYAQSIIRQRQKQRRFEREESVRELKRIIEEKRIEQQTRAIQLAAALRQLAIGSTKANEFDENFQKVVKESTIVPIIFGQIEKPAEKDFPMTLRLDGDFHRWSTNQSAIRQQFCANLTNIFQLPKDSLRIVRVEQGSAVLHIIAPVPYGQVMVEKLAKDSEIARLNMEKLKECCRKFASPLCSVTLGEMGLKIEDRVMDPSWNRIYVFSRGQTNGTFWLGSLDRGGKPYFCPKGWTRYAIKVAENSAAFDIKWGSWHIAYHGTRGRIAPLILKTGLRPNTAGCFAKKGTSRVYLTPSIEYAAHPRYARPWKKRDKQNQWYQLVFQCRVNPTAVGKAYCETLILDDENKRIPIDENFSNRELEWVIPAESVNDRFIQENIICYGIMIRKSECDPKGLQASHWWKYTYANEINYD